MYSEYYGLSGRPFQLTPDPSFYFDSRTHRKAMAYLGYGLAQGEGFIVITGDIGAGKTTLVGHLMETIDRTRLTAVQIVSTQVEGDDILRLAAQGLGIATEGAEKAQLLDRVERFLHEEARRGKRTLIVIDEAQNLATSALEELRMLSNFQDQGRALVQIFLLGQPEFRTKLQKSDSLEQLRQRVIATHHLEPMNADEIALYVEHRLKLVNWQGNPHFDDAAYEALYRHSGGIPRKLNTLAGRVLLYGAVEQLETLDGAAVEAVVADMAADDVVEERTHVEFARPHRQAAPALAPVAAPVVQDEALIARVASLEARIEEQDAALRRVLDLLVDWVEGDAARPARADLYRQTAA